MVRTRNIILLALGLVLLVGLAAPVAAAAPASAAATMAGPQAVYAESYNNLTALIFVRDIGGFVEIDVWFFYLGTFFIGAVDGILMPSFVENILVFEFGGLTHFIDPNGTWADAACNSGVRYAWI